MHDITRRTGRVLARLAVFCILTLSLLGTEASASAAGVEESEIRAVTLEFLRNYQETSLLYEERDLRANTVADPGLVLPEGAGETVFQISGKDRTLEQLRENIRYLEKKAAFYAGMRQMQGIYREDLRLTYSLDTLKMEEDVCLASVTSTAEFRYTDCEQLSVYETGYSVRLVKLDERWLVADMADGGPFDKTYKDSGTLDVDAALEEFAGQLAAENCKVTFSGGTPASGNWIEYNGANAAAYACTYARREAGEERADFYNPLFFSYAGEGGDCQNFASQCMWAGFGGSEDSGSVKGLALPMDTAGTNQWFGRAASGGKINYSWLSCQSFRQYLTGSRDASGAGGSNGAGDAGMYATVLDVGAGSPVSGVTAEELVGASAHVDGSGGLYSHAIVFTAATGVSRSEIRFCGHTRDVTNVKLGDIYIGPIKVYIPRYLRTGETSASLRTVRLRPVAAGETGGLIAWADGIQRQMSITVTPPGGPTEQAAFTENMDSCWAEYLFSTPGLYRVDCRAESAVTTFYVRCYAAAEIVPDEDTGEEFAEEPVEEGIDISEMPSWLLTR